MRLQAIPDPSGKAKRWVNADHLVSVGRLQHGRPTALLCAELKVGGMPLYRAPIGPFVGTAEADAAWSSS
jgi:hypothetical protein